MRVIASVVVVALLTIAAGTPARGADKVAVVATMTGALANLNPLTYLNATLWVMNNIFFNGLTTFDDATYQARPGLAERWTVTPDGLEYVFHLRRGVVFHDGSPFTAHDVKFSWEIVCHKDNVRMADAYHDYFVQIAGCKDFREGRASAVDGVQVVDDHTLRVRLTEPSPSLLTVTAFLGILPRAVYKDIPVAGLFTHPRSRQPVGTGPFMVVRWQEGDRLIAKANPRYFLARPKLDGLVVRFLPDPQAVLTEFKNGSLDFAFFADMIPEEFEAAKQNPQLVTRQYRGLWHYFLTMDMANPVFKDVRVRQALDAAVDREALVKQVYRGYARLVNSPVNPMLPSYANVAFPRHDPEAARRLLGAAGWTPAADGVMQRDGTRLALTLLTTPGPTRNLAIVYQDMLKRVGVETKLEVVDFISYWTQRFRPGKFDLLSARWPNALFQDPGSGLYPFLCANTRNGYCDEEADALIKKGRRTLDLGERSKIYRTLQEKLGREAPWIWTVVPDDLRLASRRLVLPERPTDYLAMKAITDWDIKE